MLFILPCYIHAPQNLLYRASILEQQETSKILSNKYVSLIETSLQMQTEINRGESWILKIKMWVFIDKLCCIWTTSIGGLANNTIRKLEGGGGGRR